MNDPIIYVLRDMPDGSVYFENPSPMFPIELENRINELAGQQITAHGPELGGFFGNLVNSFHIKKEFVPLFDSFSRQILDETAPGHCFLKSALAEANCI